VNNTWWGWGVRLHPPLGFSYFLGEKSNRDHFEEKIGVCDMIVKLGLDIHGVIDRYPTFFIEAAKRLVQERQAEIHVITGVRFSDRIDQQLRDYDSGNKWWSHFFSLTDYLISQNCDYTFDKHNRHSFDNLIWDRVKGDYCAENNITLHIDDTERYASYFKTPVIILREPEDLNFIHGILFMEKA
jgi:hypothetical protein